MASNNLLNRTDTEEATARSGVVNKLDRSSVDATMRAFRAALPEKLTKLSQLVESARATRDGMDLLEARSIAHKLGGTLGCFGYIRLGEAMKRIDFALARASHDGDWANISLAVASLQVPVEPEDQAVQPRRLRVIDDDPDFFARLTSAARTRDLAIENVTALIATTVPGIANVAAYFVSMSPSLRETSLALLAATRANQRSSTPKVFAIVDDSSVHERLLSRRAGATRFVSRQMGRTELGEVLDQLGLGALQRPAVG